MVSEYVIRGNTAVLKCNIPSFVADFVRVEAWVGSDESEYTYGSDYGESLRCQVPPPASPANQSQTVAHAPSNARSSLAFQWSISSIRRRYSPST